ncbi:RNaseH domain-containing protein [Lentzea sp. JNUCC 0626]|uniref:RNaseH domain-containing protein n=1 Tax=Lentzea sp. JNUCC 0626 TaxID=3367513 RepID=UPI0037482A2E
MSRSVCTSPHYAHWVSAAPHATAQSQVSRIASVFSHDGFTPRSERAGVERNRSSTCWVAGAQEGDQPERWAAPAHDLLRAEPFSHRTITLPWPLHLAQQIGKYVRQVHLARNA